MKVTRILLLTLLTHVATVGINAYTVAGPETVFVRSGSLRLRALVWRPPGKGPFPAVFFNHGRGLTPLTEGRVEGITELGQLFARHGYVLMALFRRGEDLSANQGVFIGDLLERERAARGVEAEERLKVRLMESDHLADAIAGLTALRQRSEVDPCRVAVIGHSFGGSLALLVAERAKFLRAAVIFAAAAGSWETSAELRKRLISAVGRIDLPVLSIYAANDYSITPGEILNTEMARREKVHRLKLFPAFGQTAKEGHWFVYLGVATWEQDVFAFLDPIMRSRSCN